MVSTNCWQLYQFFHVEVSSTNYCINLLLLDDSGRVRSHIINVVCQIQRFDLECNLVVARKVIMRIPPGLEINPLHRYSSCSITIRMQAIARLYPVQNGYIQLYMYTTACMAPTPY